VNTSLATAYRLPTLSVAFLPSTEIRQTGPYQLPAMHGASREFHYHNRHSPRSYRGKRRSSPRYDSRGEFRRLGRVEGRYDGLRHETPPGEERDRSPMPPHRGRGARSQNSQSLGRRSAETRSRSRHHSQERSQREKYGRRRWW
jgi:hypothetical protein